MFIDCWLFFQNAVITLPEVTASAIGGPPRFTSPDGRSRLKSLSLLDPDCNIQLMDLTEQDYDVNAPAGSLLHGTEILTALDVPVSMQ